MRERSEVGARPDAEEEPRKKRLDLSVPQVAGSAVAAVVAAKLASYFGVYGTILGAGLISIIATCGGTVFQHFFSRTGEQLREVTVQPKSRVSAGRRPGDPARPVAASAPGEFTDGTVYRARVKSWKRPVVAAALVFGVTMAGITTYELVSGDSFSGGVSTTVGGALSGRTKTPTTTDNSPSPSGTPSSVRRTPSGGASSESGGGGTTQNPTPTPTPSATKSPDAGSDGSRPRATPTPGASATTPAPDASSRSQSAVPGQAGPATP
ncbi:hypothetical protein [Streptomyces avermitilis]|uniref:hypothetical protein n=1 Tax=Streptomyces avermitilis TaxID=33903 RepID=UPI00371D927F